MNAVSYNLRPTQFKFTEKKTPGSNVSKSFSKYGKMSNWKSYRSNLNENTDARVQVQKLVRYMRDTRDTKKKGEG